MFGVFNELASALFTKELGGAYCVATVFHYSRTKARWAIPKLTPGALKTSSILYYHSRFGTTWNPNPGHVRNGQSFAAFDFLLPRVSTTATVQGALGSGNNGNLLPGNYNSANYATSSNWWRLFYYNANGSPPASVMPLIGDPVSVGTGYWIKSFVAPEGGRLEVTGTATPVTTGGGVSANGCWVIPLTVAANRYNMYNVEWSKCASGSAGSVAQSTPQSRRRPPM